MRKSYAILIFLGVTMAFNALVIGSAFAEQDEECNLLHLSVHCDLSGWMTLILGDVMISAALAVFLHYLAYHSTIKIEQNIKATKENNVAIQKILSEQQETRTRRQIYVVQSFKNHLGSLLLCVGIINRFSGGMISDKDSPKDTPSKGTDKRRELESILHRIQNTLSLSIDVIDPMLIEQIEQFLITIEQKVLNSKDPLDYDGIKGNIMKLTKRLNEYASADEVLK